ncbi:uncharacterized protein B0T15DRAFT_488377 [Chaetomium strumarium]|uniref:DUF1772-domain-containing protein n=1 Tax=Chaetomium strumarium TaxID=1170767 RepID=A0AAJ0M5I3_9PEZI|nr:hypothetical protein B0T15DRAFT_488377 [Chaetomium strumarium]
MSSLNNPTSVTSLRLTQGTALFLSSFSSGVSLTLSAFVVPRLLESPRGVMLTQWLRTYTLGATTMPFATAVTAAAYVWLGLKTPGIPLARSRMYLAAAGLTVGIIPYTVAFMGGTNGRLKEMEKEANSVQANVPSPEVRAEERSAKALVDWWGMLNLGRAAMLISGAVCGLVATL